MTICVSVKTRDGIVLGTDSMSTISLQGSEGQQAGEKLYSNARKLVQVGNLPVGVFTYGLGNLGTRTVHSHILEFSRTNKENSVREIAVGLSQHILTEYSRVTRAIDDDKRPILGFFVAGYSQGSVLPEEWEVLLPNSPIPRQTRAVDDFGVSWRGVPTPFARLFLGYEPLLLQTLEEKGVSPELLQSVVEGNPFVAKILIGLMPLQDAINFAVFVLRTTIGFTSFETGTTTCGGQLQLAVISEEAQEARFQWVSKPEFRIPEDTNEWA